MERNSSFFVVMFGQSGGELVALGREWDRTLDPHEMVAEMLATNGCNTCWVFKAETELGCDLAIFRTGLRPRFGEV